MLPVTAAELMDYAKELGYGELHLHVDPSCDLLGIVAIHSTKLGPALGGARFIEYSDVNHALRDAIRLAHGMSLKNALAGIPHGGGKAVIMKPKIVHDKKAFWESFGRFIQNLGGRYITALDSGTDLDAMDYMANECDYVASRSELNGDPSPYTAEGVFQSIKVAARFKLEKDNLRGLHVAIQGLGAVGMKIAEKCHAEGATLTVCDRDVEKVERCIQQFGAQAVDNENIHTTECDILSPCALGATLDETTIPELRCKIIAGGANNQLATPADGDRLHDRGILYAPDYLINAGGVVYVAYRHKEGTAVTVDPQRYYEIISEIPRTLAQVFERAANENRATNHIADSIALSRLQ